VTEIRRNVGMNRYSRVNNAGIRLDKFYRTHMPLA